MLPLHAVWKVVEKVVRHATKCVASSGDNNAPDRQKVSKTSVQHFYNCVRVLFDIATNFCDGDCIKRGVHIVYQH